jgi:hypothetical protein
MLTNCDIFGNIATGGTGGAGDQSGDGGDGGFADSGGFANWGATTQMPDESFANNVATGGNGGPGGQLGAGGNGGEALGGAIASAISVDANGVVNDVSLTVNRSLFTGNTAMGGTGGSGGSGASGGSGGDAMGGGLYTSSVDIYGNVGLETLEIGRRCVFVGNEADGGARGASGGGTAGTDGSGYGGAIFIGSGDACISKKTKFADNHASTADNNIAGSYTSC